MINKRLWHSGKARKLKPRNAGVFACHVGQGWYACWLKASAGASDACYLTPPVCSKTKYLSRTECWALKSSGSRVARPYLPWRSYASWHFPKYLAALLYCSKSLHQPQHVPTIEYTLPQIPPSICLRNERFDRREAAREIGRAIEHGCRGFCSCWLCYDLPHKYSPWTRWIPSSWRRFRECATIEPALIRWKPFRGRPS